MTWLTSLRHWWRPQAADTSTLNQPTDWLRAGWGGVRTLFGGSALPTVPADEALTLSAYYACLRNISEDVGKLPLCVYRRVQGGKEKDPNHPVYPLLHDAPNPDMTAMTFRTTLTHHAVGWGNGYAWIMRDGPDVVALYPLHPSRVVYRRDDQGRRRYLVYGGVDDPRQDLGGWLWIDPQDMLHILGLSWDGYTGYSVVQLAQLSLGLALNAETFGSRFFENGTHLGGVLRHPGTLSDTARVHLAESLRTQYGGAANAGKTMILEENMAYEKLGIPPNDAQYIETRQFETLEFCRWLRMPPHKIANLTDAHYNNPEQLNQEYVSDTLGAWLVRWEQEVKRKLFADEPLAFAEHNVKGLLRGDHMARAQFYRTLFELGAFTTNMILENENENPAGPEGDVRFIAANNLQPLRSFTPGTTPVMPVAPRPGYPPVPTNGAQHTVGMEGRV